MSEENKISNWIDHVVLGLIVLLIVSMGLLFTTKTTDTNLFKELSMVVLIPVCFFAFMAKYFIEGRFNLTASPMNLPVLVFLAVAVVSFFTHPKLMFFSKFTFIKYVLFVCIFFLMSNLIRTRRQLKVVLYSLVVVALLCAVYGLMQKFPESKIVQEWLGFTSRFNRVPHFPLLKGLIIWANHPRIPSTFGNPNFFAAYIVLMTPLVFALIGSSKNIFSALFAGAVAAILTLCVVLTQTRGGWLGYAAGFVIYVLFFIFTVERDRIAHKPVFWLCATAFLVVAAVYLTQNEIVSKRIKRTIVNMHTGQGTVDSRSVFYKGTLGMFTARPLFGQGVGSFQIRFPFYRPNDYRMHRVSHNTRHSHSEYLQLLGEMGIIGLAGFLAVVAATVKTAWGVFTRGRNINYVFIGTGLLLILAGFFAYVLLHPGIIITGAIFAAGFGVIFFTLLLTGKESLVSTGDKYYRHIALGLFASIIGILVHNLVSVNLRWVEAAFFMWFNMGLLAAVARLEKEQRQSATSKKGGSTPESDQKTFHLFPLTDTTKAPAMAGFCILALAVSILSMYHYINFYKSELHRAAGVLHLEVTKRYDLAKQEFEKSVHYYYPNLSSRYKVAFIYGLIDRDVERAYREYKIVTRFAPHYSEIHYNLTSNCLSVAQLAARNKDSEKEKKFLEEAEQQAKMAVNIQNSSKNHMLYVRVLAARDKRQEAEAEYLIAKQRAKLEKERRIAGMSKSELVAEWVVYLLRWNQISKAEKELREVYDEYQEELTSMLDQVSAEINSLARSSFSPEQKQFLSSAVIKKAVARYNLLQRYYKPIVDISYRLAEIYRIQRKIAESEEILTRLVAENPDNGLVHFLMARHYLAAGKRFKARSELQSALELDKKSKWVKDAQEMLRRIEQNI